MPQTRRVSLRRLNWAFNFVLLFSDVARRKVVSKRRHLHGRTRKRVYTLPALPLVLRMYLILAGHGKFCGSKSPNVSAIRCSAGREKMEIWCVRDPIVRAFGRSPKLFFFAEFSLFFFDMLFSTYF